MNLKKAFLSSTFSLLALGNCTSVQHSLRNFFEEDPSRGCPAMNLSDNTDVQRALALFNQTEEGQLLVANTLGRGTKLCLNTSVNPDGAQYSLIYDTIFIHPARSENHFRMWATFLYHEMTHAYQDHAAERGLHADTPVSGETSPYDLLLYTEAAAYISQTRFLIEMHLQNRWDIPEGLEAHNVRLYRMMLADYNSASRSLSHKEKLDQASVRAFTAMVRADTPEFSNLRFNLALKHDIRRILDIGGSDPAHKVHAFTTLPGGLNLKREHDTHQLTASQTPQRGVSLQ